MRVSSAILSEVAAFYCSGMQTSIGVTGRTDAARHIEGSARRGVLYALWGACLFGGLGQSLAGSAGALLAVEVSGSEGPAGLPQAALVVGSAGAALALSRLTVARGRTRALTTGVLVAVVGCVVVAVGAAFGSLPLVLVGSLLLGSGSTAVMLARYAAADMGPLSARGRAMGLVLAATTVGAVAGPNLLAPASALADLLGWPALAGPYLLASVAFAAAGGTLALGQPVTPRPATSETRLTTPGASRAWRPSGMVGLGVLSLANLVMVAVMTMAPVQLHLTGSRLAAIGVVVSLHIAGMFAPSPISGWLTDRIGAPFTAGLAGITLALACGLAAIAGTAAALATAMVLLGVGWNLALLSGSALLSASVDPFERPRREGWGEVGMGLAAGGGVAASGPVMGIGGYGLLAVIAMSVAACVVPLATVALVGPRRT